MMKRIFVILMLLLWSSVCFASGWNDFTLDIGDGYNVFRANSMDVCIGKEDGSLILYPDKYNNVGPVIRYITSPEFIFTKNLGRKPRNLFDGDTFQDIDSSQEFFFIISKGTDEVVGPLSASQFHSRPEVASLASLDWQIPKNPNFWLPLFGSLMFLAIAILILAIKYLWITVPVIIVFVLLIRSLRKKRKEKGTAQPIAELDRGENSASG
jgi:uncharacterized membrane protein